MKRKQKSRSPTPAIHPKIVGKKGMEMWQLVLLILALILLLAVIVWYGFLGGEIDKLLGKLGDLL